jgi:hypothetical protein
MMRRMWRTYSTRAKALGSGSTSKGGNDSEGLHLEVEGWKRMLD